MKRCIALLALATLTACAGPAQYGPDSPNYRYPAGLRLVLERTIEIPPEFATVRLQFGAVVARNAVQEHEPHCIFEVDTVSDGQRRISPDDFEVVDVRRSVWVSEVWSSDAARLVRVGLPFGDTSPTFILYRTEFRLRSARQPDVRSLTCQSNQNAPGIAVMRHLTVAEIRQALGAYFTLHLPPAGARDTQGRS